MKTIEEVKLELIRIEKEYLRQSNDIKLELCTLDNDYNITEQTIYETRAHQQEIRRWRREAETRLSMLKLQFNEETLSLREELQELQKAEPENSRQEA